jgi:hypothetical protein
MRRAVTSLAVLLAAGLGCLASVASADYKAAVLALSPDHYYQLDETVEGTAFDAAGGINGTHQGFFGDGLGQIGVPGPDLPGFDSSNLAFGANDASSVGLGPGTAFANGTLTVAAWFKVAGSQGGDRLWTNNQSDPNTQFQIFFGGGSGDVAANIGFSLNSSINGFPLEGLPSGDTVGNFHIPETTVAVKNNQWHHIVASRNGNNIEDVIVVIDGVNYGVDTWRDSTDTWGTTGSNAQIGTRTPPDGGPSLQAINGSVDEVAVWLGRQLTVAEAISLYQAAVGSTPLPGDANGDNMVDLLDLAILGENFGQSPRTFSQGNFNEPQDTIVDLLDLAVLGANFGAGASVSVPEPATPVLALIGLACLSFRRPA